MSEKAVIHSKLLDAITEPRVREQVSEMIDLCILAMQGLDSLDQKIFQRSLDTEKSLESFSNSVLCVLSNEQREEFCDELAELSGRGITLVHEDDPDIGLARVLDVKPWYVIVGLEIGFMEGLEFVALLMRRYPNSGRSILVLPNKGDPFPPVLQSRDASTGKGKTENVGMTEVWDLIAAMAQELQKQGRAGDKGALGQGELESLAKSTLAGARDLAAYLKTIDVAQGESDDDAGEDDFDFDLDEAVDDAGEDDFDFDMDEALDDADDFEFDLGGPVKPAEMSLDDDDIVGAIDGLAPEVPPSSQETWSKLSSQISSLSYALSSELKDFDRRFSNVLASKHFVQALRDLYGLSASMGDGVFALMGFVCEAYIGDFDRNELLPGHKDALGKALLVRCGLAELRRVVNEKNRLVQDSSLAEAERARALERLGTALGAFTDGEVFAIMRPGDRLELTRFAESIAGKSSKEAALACEGLDKYLDSLLSVNQRDVLINHDRQVMSEIEKILEGVAPLVEISPHGAIELVREGFAKSEALRGSRDDLDDLLREWRVESHSSSLPGALLGMGDRLAAFVASG